MNIYGMLGPSDGDIIDYVNNELDPNEFANVWSDNSYFEYSSIDVISKDKRSKDVYMVDYDAIITDGYTDIALSETLRYEKREGKWTAVSNSERDIPIYKAVEECTPEIVQYPISLIVNSADFTVTNVEELSEEDTSKIMPSEYIDGSIFDEWYGQAVKTNYVKVTADMTASYSFLNVTGDRYFYLFWNPLEECWDASVSQALPEEQLYAENYGEEWNIDGTYQVITKTKTNYKKIYTFSIHNTGENIYKLDWVMDEEDDVFYTRTWRNQDSSSQNVRLADTEDADVYKIQEKTFPLDDFEVLVTPYYMYAIYGFDEIDIERLDNMIMQTKNIENRPYFLSDSSNWGEMRNVFLGMSKEALEELLGETVVESDFEISIGDCKCYSTDSYIGYLYNIKFFIDDNGLEAIYVCNSWDEYLSPNRSDLYYYVTGVNGENKIHDQEYEVNHADTLNGSYSETIGNVNGYVHWHPNDNWEEALIYNADIQIDSWRGLSVVNE